MKTKLNENYYYDMGYRFKIIKCINLIIDLNMFLVILIY